MKHLQHLIALTIFVSTLSLHAMYPCWYILKDKDLELDSTVLNNPEKKPVFRILIDNNLQQNILQHVIAEHTIQYLHDALYNTQYKEQIEHIMLDNGILMQTSASIIIETIVKKKDRITDTLTQEIYNDIPSNQPAGISYQYDKYNKELHLITSIFCQLYEYLPATPLNPIPIS